MQNDKHGSNWAFWIMSMIHDNPLRRRFGNPYETLKNAGVKSGQNVLEIGCGPGYFTIPCSKIVGDTGTVYALDNHPLAIKRVQLKINKRNRRNITLIAADAASTGLPDQSIDLAFLFGVPRILRNELAFKNILTELKRVLRKKGYISIKSSRKQLITWIEDGSMVFIGEKNGIFTFKKTSGE